MKLQDYLEPNFGKFLFKSFIDCFVSFYAFLEYFSHLILSFLIIPIGMAVFIYFIIKGQVLYGILSLLISNIVLKMSFDVIERNIVKDQQNTYYERTKIKNINEI